MCPVVGILNRLYSHYEIKSFTNSCSCCRTDAESLPRYSSGKSERALAEIRLSAKDCHIGQEVIEPCNRGIDCRTRESSTMRHPILRLGAGQGGDTQNSTDGDDRVWGSKNLNLLKPLGPPTKSPHEELHVKWQRRLLEKCTEAFHELTSPPLILP